MTSRATSLSLGTRLPFRRHTLRLPGKLLLKKETYRIKVNEEEQMTTFKCPCQRDNSRVLTSLNCDSSLTYFSNIIIILTFLNRN